MIPFEMIDDFVSEHHCPIMTYAFDKSKTSGAFILNYYDTFILMSLTESELTIVNEEMLEVFKLHKKKIFFEFTYNRKKKNFSLSSIYFNSTYAKGTRIVTVIKNQLYAQNMGGAVTEIRIGGNAYVQIKLVTPAQMFNEKESNLRL